MNETAVQTSATAGNPIAGAPPAIARPFLPVAAVVVRTTSKANTAIAGLHDLGAGSCISNPAHFEGLLDDMRAVGQYGCKIVELLAST